MPRVIQRACAWCGQMIDTKRSHTKLHAACAVPIHRSRLKLVPASTAADFFLYIESEMKEGRHPNPKHPLNNKEEE